MGLRSGTVTLFALLLMGCQAGTPTSAWIVRTASTGTAGQTTRNDAPVRDGVAGGTLTIELDWSDMAYNLLATTVGPARVVAQLWRVTDSGTELVNTLERSRAAFVNGKPVFQFTSVPVGTYELRFSAFDDAGRLIAENIVRVLMEAGKVQQLRSQLKRVSPRVSSPAPSTQPQPNEVPSAPVMASQAPSTPPPPVWTPAPTPMASAPGMPNPQPAPSTMVTPVPSGSIKPAPTPTPPPVSQPSPVAPVSAAPSAVPSAIGTPAQALGSDLPGLLSEGETRDLLSPVHTLRFNRMLATWSAGSRTTLESLINTCQSRTEAILVLKALAASEPWENVTAFASEIRGLNDGTLIQKTTMRDDPDLIQQWQDACGPTLVLTAVGEQDPRYAWELNKLYALDKVDISGANKNLADLQKTWLEEYGGVAVPRGASGGQGIGILYLLNDKLSPITSASYTVQDTSDLGGGLNAIEQSLKAGYDVPLRLIWNTPDETPERAHFMLAMASMGQSPNRQFQIHDTYTGRTAWVSEAAIRADSFAPLYQVYAHLTHYYRPTPKS